MKRSVRRLLIFLVLGVVVNVALSWGPLAWRQWFVLRSSPSAMPVFRDLDGMTAEERALWERDRPESFPAHPQSAFAARAWNFDRMHVSGASSRTESGALVLWGVGLWRAGWPLRSFEGWSWLQQELKQPAQEWDHCLLKSKMWVKPPRQFILPLRVMWVGFAVNSLMFASLLWLILSAPLDYRRWKRIKRGCCPACGYPVGASAVCTECGGAVRRNKC